MEPDHEQPGLLEWLDGPRLVVGAFIFFMLALSVLGILLWSDQRDQQQQLVEQVARIDELAEANRGRVKATNEEAVARCFSTAAQGPALRRVLRALENQTPDPQARADLMNFRLLNEANTSTVAECRALARRLHVPVPEEYTR
jgi:hypothetical protein